MMRSLAFVLAFAMLAENIVAFLPASTLKAPTFLAVEDASVLLAAEVRHELGDPKLKDEDMLACVIFAFGASLFGCFGVGFIISALRIRREGILMMGDDAVEATATITSTRTYTTTSNDTDGHNKITTYHYEASYWFEAVRVDGMRCRITVKDREVGSNVYESCHEGSRQRVRYLGDEPQHCRLTQGAQEDKQVKIKWWFCGVCFLTGSLGLVFAAAEPFGVLGVLVCGFVCYGLVCCCVLGCGDRGPWIFCPTGANGASLEELGMQEPSSKLGNISGTWSLQSDMGTFEYKFAMADEKSFSLTVQGRLEGNEWDPEYQACFTDGRTMNWKDNQGTAFCATFENAQKFDGCAKATDGSELAFVGLRKK